MNKKILKQIKEFAKILPDVKHQSAATITGAEILAKNPKAKDKDGNAIKANSRYKVPALVNENHVTNMKKIYNQKGEKGLYEYADRMKQIRDAKKLTASTNEVSQPH